MNALFPPSAMPASVQSIFSQICRLTQGRQDAHHPSIHYFHSTQSVVILLFIYLKQIYDKYPRVIKSIRFELLFFYIKKIIK